MAEHVPPGSTRLSTDAWQRDRSRHPCPAAVAHAVHAWGREAHGEGQREVRGHTCERAAAARRTSWRPFRGVHTQDLQLYVATSAAMVQAKRVTVESHPPYRRGRKLDSENSDAGQRSGSRRHPKRTGSTRRRSGRPLCPVRRKDPITVMARAAKGSGEMTVANIQHLLGPIRRDGAGHWGRNCTDVRQPLHQGKSATSPIFSRLASCAVLHRLVTDTHRGGEDSIPSQHHGDQQAVEQGRQAPEVMGQHTCIRFNVTPPPYARLARRSLR